jgi:hypothetical protein
MLGVQHVGADQADCGSVVMAFYDLYELLNLDRDLNAELAVIAAHVP